MTLYKLHIFFFQEKISALFQAPKQAIVRYMCPPSKRTHIADLAIGWIWTTRDYFFITLAVYFSLSVTTSRIYTPGSYPLRSTVLFLTGTCLRQPLTVLT